ncbi:MAG TPA: hypothetical protein VJS11_03300 [Acidobacteriaceae bacterium]|nr:hypothetical protein [Acidobacteriaceae bacterium]
MIWVQSRIFLNSFRRMRGGFELGARILSFVMFFFVSIGPAVGMGFGAYQAALHGRSIGLAILFWVLCLVWQFFSAFAPALAGQNPDLSHLLRYPVSFGSWMLLYLVYGIASPSTLIGLLWATGIGIGLDLARPDLALWSTIVLIVFVLFNILLSRTILSWIERVMAQRRTREIVTGVLLVLALAGQAFNPAFHQTRHGNPYGLRGKTIQLVAHRFWTVQKYLPPGAATVAVDQQLRESGSGALPFGALLLYTAGIGALLGMRLRAESRGENLSEVRHAPAKPAAVRQPQRRALDFSGPIAAVLEKDLRYLLRSGPMLYALAAPIVMVFVFGGAIRAGSFSAVRTAYSLPLGIIWAFMGLTQMVSNSFGAEGHGIQFYFLSPTPLRKVVLAKNAMHLLLFAVEALVITGIVLYRFGLPPLSVAAATLAWILFAVPMDFAAGNLLSVLMPYRVNLTRMRRQEFSLGNGMLSMLAQALILGTGAAVMLPCVALHRPWLAAPILLALAAAGLLAYAQVLRRIDGLVESHRESLIHDVAK